MIEHLVTSTILMLLIILLRCLLGKRISQRLKYSLWLLVALKLLIPVPVFENAFYIMNVVNKVEDRLIEYQLVDKTEKAETLNQKQVSNMMGDKSSTQLENTALEKKLIERNSSKQVSHILIVIWYLGVFLCSFAFIMSNLCFYRKLRKSRRNKESIYQNLSIYEADCLDSPCLFGIIHLSGLVHVCL